MNRPLLLILLLVGEGSLVAQEMTLENGSMVVQSGTRVAFDGPLNWTLGQNGTVVNDGLIEFGQATLTELPGAPITGLGTETAVLAHPGGAFSSVPGGLGLRITGDLEPDTMMVIRGHTATSVGSSISSVARWYGLSGQVLQTAVIDVTMNMDATELNGLVPQDLELHRASTLDGPWIPLPGTVDLLVPSVTGVIQSNDAYLTAFMADIMTGTDEEPDKIDLFVWPTVTEDILNVQLSEAGIVTTLELFDRTGRSVAPMVVRQGSSSATINTAHLARGLYLIRVNGLHEQRFIRP